MLDYVAFPSQITPFSKHNFTSSAVFLTPSLCIILRLCVLTVCGLINRESATSLPLLPRDNCLMISISLSDNEGLSVLVVLLHTKIGHPAPKVVKIASKRKTLIRAVFLPTHSVSFHPKKGKKRKWKSFPIFLPMRVHLE